MKEITFTQFWNAYALKRDRIAAERAWNRLGKKDRLAAFDGIRAYRQDCANNNRMMMYAQGYITHRRWEDEPDGTVASPASPPTPLLGEGRGPKPTSHADGPDNLLPAGCRIPTDEERAMLDGLKDALRKKPHRKPLAWLEFQEVVVDGLTIPFVSVARDTIHLCVEHDGKRERLSDFMLDYYDSYADFYAMLSLHFPNRNITFSY